MKKKRVPILKKSGEACYVDESGKTSDEALHEAIMDGVDDSDLRKETYERLKAAGMDEETLKLFK